MDKIEKQEKEIAEEYLSSLVDLNINSKPLINMLTILAEENIEHGQVIVDAVEQHIAKVFIYFIFKQFHIQQTTFIIIIIIFPLYHRLSFHYLHIF